MKRSILIFVVAVVVCVAGRPEPPRGRYVHQQQSAPQRVAPAPRQEFGPPPPPPQQPPSAPGDSYGPPPNLEYGPPFQTYGPPQQQQKIITKHVYVHIPPPEESVESLPAQTIDVPTPKKHYKIIFIKAPNAPVPTAPVIPEQPQDEHKTLVYVLVKKPEPQPEVEIPVAEPTEPSKPEVFFIKYKGNENAPAEEYGAPARFQIPRRA